MKNRIAISLLLLFIATGVQGQKNLDMKDLALPNSPAFILLDESPSNIVSPLTPKNFNLGLLQNFDTRSKWFQNYFMEATPYWWVNPADRDFYKFIGVSPDTSNPGTFVNKPFYGLRFTSISLGLLNKDLVPDTIDYSHNIGSLGVRIPVIKIRNRSYAAEVGRLTKQWHTEAQEQLQEIGNITAMVADPLKRKKMIDNLLNTSSETTEKLKELANEKPLFSFDLALAHSQYRVNDSLWKAGRSGAWITTGLFLPLQHQRPYTNYFEVLGYFRYTSDNFIKIAENQVGRSQSLDMGFKLGVDIDKFSIAVESIWRKTANSLDRENLNRTVGILNYRISDNLYISATYGENFEPGKQVALFGLNWGFGNEKVKIKEQ